MTAKHCYQLLAAALFALSCGCSESNGLATSDTHDDDQHAEHFVPPHKPSNYAQAVEDIEHRAAHLADHAGHGHDDEAEEFRELVDIVEWIPELAADSDLSETDWNAACDAGQLIASELRGRSKKDGSLALDDLDDSIQSSLIVLQGLVQAAGKPEPRIDHDDNDHDDHDHDDHDDHDHDDHDHDEHDHDEHDHDEHDHDEHK